MTRAEDTAVALETHAPPAMGTEPQSGRKRWLPIVPGVLIVALWELCAHWFFPNFLPRPSRIVMSLPGFFSDSLISEQFWGSLTDTALAIIEGILIGILFGVPAGLVLGRITVARWFGERYVHALNSMPVVAIIPLSTLWLGYSNNMRLAVTALSAYLPITLNVMDGTRNLPSTYLDVARSFRAKRRQLWFGVAMPAAMPYVVSGVQIAAGRAMVTGITAEMIAAIPGLGFFVIFQARSFHHNEAFVGVLVIAGFGILLLRVINWSTGRLVPWYRAEAERG